MSTLLELVLDGETIAEATIGKGKSAELSAEVDAKNVRVNAMADGVSLTVTAPRPEEK